MTGTPRDDLARFIRDELQEAADGREDVAYEQIEAYVDGALDDVDREISRRGSPTIPACARRWRICARCGPRWRPRPRRPRAS